MLLLLIFVYSCTSSSIKNVKKKSLIYTDSIVDKALESDSFYIYIKQKSNQKRYIVWGNKKTNTEKITSDTIFNMSSNSKTSLNNISTTSEYFYFTYSGGTGLSIGTFLPIKNNFEVKQFICPMAFSKEKPYIVHFTFNWSNKDTFFVITNLITNNSKYYKIKRCLSIFPPDCISNVEFIPNSNKVVISWFTDITPNKNDTDKVIIELDF